MDLQGKRPSITSAGGDESGGIFTIVGTDLSGNVQTEVITGPIANATVFGSSANYFIITPSVNTSGQISMGYRGWKNNKWSNWFCHPRRRYY